MFQIKSELRCVIIHSKGDVDRELRQSIRNFADVSVIDSVEESGTRAGLVQLLRDTTPDLVFVSTDSVAGCAMTATLLKDLDPRISVIAIGKSCGVSVLTALLETGCDEYLAAPIDQSCLKNSLERVRERCQPRLHACA